MAYIGGKVCVCHIVIIQGKDSMTMHDKVDNTVIVKVKSQHCYFPWLLAAMLRVSFPCIFLSFSNKLVLFVTNDCHQVLCLVMLLRKFLMLNLILLCS